MVEAVKLKIQDDHNDGWKKMETHFKVESARLAGSTGKEMPRRFLNVQSSLGKSLALFIGFVTKALDMGSNSVKSPFTGAKKAKRPRKGSGSKQRTEGPSSGNDNIDFGSV